MRTFVRLVIIITLLNTSAWAQNLPKIAYAFPAGGERGTSVEVTLAGRQIARANLVLVSGEGVTGTILSAHTSRALNNAAERAFIRRTFQEARLQLLLDRGVITEEIRDAAVEKLTALFSTVGSGEDTIQVPDYTLEEMAQKYQLVGKLANPTPLDLQEFHYEYFYARPDRNPKESFAQAVIVQLTIAADVPPGDREIRLSTPSGVTAPIRFVVGTFPEVNEIEPNDTDTPNVNEWMPDSFNTEITRDLPEAQRDELLRHLREDRAANIKTLETLTLPVVINGQIRPGDVDRFRFQAEKGQKIVIAMQARYLIPYLADAVPGWFQGMLSLRCPNGDELTNASSYRFEADPLICVEIPESGVYTLDVRDTLFRGRDDFVYRISVGETPLVTAVFPLGGQTDAPVEANIQGWNLPANAVQFDTSPGDAVRVIHEINGQPLLRPIRYAVDSLPEITITESAAETSETPTAVTLPVIINSRIMSPTGVDTFQFTGRKGETIVADVAARSLDSPLDAMLELIAPDGTLLAQNDDRADSTGPNIGLATHHADPYLLVTLPVDGTYTVRLYNTGQRGGAEYAYRLRLSPPQPGFAVYSVPSAVALLGGTRPLSFRAVRYDGFEGAITITLPEGAPFRLPNAVIPADGDRVATTLAATNQFAGPPEPLEFIATGKLDDREIVTTVLAGDSHEQAFIYHHIIPASGFTVLDGRPDRMGGR